jgi:hypothetical protein
LRRINQRTLAINKNADPKSRKKKSDIFHNSIYFPIHMNRVFVFPLRIIWAKQRQFFIFTSKQKPNIILPS